MKFVNDFIQKNSKKSDAEKHKILIVSMVVSGVFILSIGMINISNNLASIYQNENGGVEKKSSLAAIRDKFSEVLSGARDKMQTINNEIGQVQK